MKTSISRDACIGCGLCTDNVPEVYEMDNEGIAMVRTETVATEHEEAVRNAAADCPVEAIGIEE